MPMSTVIKRKKKPIHFVADDFYVLLIYTHKFYRTEEKQKCYSHNHHHKPGSKTTRENRIYKKKWNEMNTHKRCDSVYSIFLVLVFILSLGSDGRRDIDKNIVLLYIFHLDIELVSFRFIFFFLVFLHIGNAKTEWRLERDNWIMIESRMEHTK